MNSTCIAPARNSGGGSTFALDRVFDGLSFAQPIAMLQAPGDDTRWFVVQREGVVRTFVNDSNVSTSSNFANIGVNTSGEGGLLGMAFHPDYPTDNRVFLSWTESGSPLVSVVSSFATVAGGSAIDPSSEQEIIRVNQDFTNHNGGHIAFGPDGRLYIGLGDGGSGGDPNDRAQDTTNLLGAMLRLDVDGAAPYTIPADNPFAANPICPANHSSSQSCPEIYAWGLRNPWRWSFDGAVLWLGDVGQNAWEEIDQVELGGNYGWDCREGANTYGNLRAPSCPAPNMIDPVHQYPRVQSRSVTGGYVYRGAALPALAGRYVFGDYVTGQIWQLVPDGSGGYDAQEMLDTPHSIASFGQGNDGEIYVINIASGAIYRIVDGGGGGPGTPPVPTQLSATGCVVSGTPSQPASGLIEYDVGVPFWSDGADKQRWLAVPDGSTIGVDADGDFQFPNGSVLMKHFRLGSTLVETRLFMRHPDGVWAGYSYEWDSAQNDATLVQGGKVASINGQDWIFPSENDCLSCHTAAAGRSLGLEAAQLNHAISYAATGRTANQLATLDAIVMFSSPLGDPALQPELPMLDDASVPLAERARAYLHSNCSNCHRPNGPTPSSMDLRFTTELGATNSCDVVPQSGDLGLGAGARIIAPGDPAASVLLERMDRRDASAMPPLGSNRVDTDGVSLLGDWIQALASCQ
jgi:uncharacterized repeat protein (TIGR03806 family)